MPRIKLTESRPLTHKSVALPGDEEDNIWDEEGEVISASEKLKRKITKTGRLLENLNDRISLSHRIRYYIPMLTWLPQYQWKNYLPFDFLAGITVFVFLVPQCLAFSSLIGVEPMIGLQTGFYPLIVYGIFGSSRHLSVGPVALLSILTSGILDGVAGHLDDLSGEERDKRMALRGTWCALVALMIGMNNLVLGLCRFGFLVQMFSRPLLSGFVNAVAAHIILEQLGKIFGLKTKEHGFAILKEMYNLMGQGKGSYATMVIGMGCLFFLVLVRTIRNFQFKRLNWLKLFPDVLVCVLGALIVCHFSDLKNQTQILGKRKMGMMKPGLSFEGISMDMILDVYPQTISVAVIAMVESIVAANIYASKDRYRISSNRELVAMGLTNIAGAIMKTVPSAGGFSRTAASYASGAKSQMCYFFSSIFILLTILFLLPYFQNLPIASLGAVIINAALGIFEFEEVVFLWEIKAWKDLTFFILSFLLTSALGAETGILIVIAISLLLIVKHSTSPYISIMHRNRKNPSEFEEIAVIRSVGLFEEQHDYYCEFMADAGVLIMKIDEPIYFANVGQIKEFLQKLELKATVRVKAVILEAANIPFIDSSAVHTLHEIAEDWHKREIDFAIVRPTPKVIRMLSRAHILPLLAGKGVFVSTAEAIEELGLSREGVRDSLDSMGSFV